MLVSLMVEEEEKLRGLGREEDEDEEGGWEAKRRDRREEAGEGGRAVCMVIK